jgi:replication factor C subunit 2/4
LLAQTLGIDVTLIGGGDGDGDVEMDDAAPALTVESNLRGFDLIRGTVRSLVREGFSASQVLSQVCCKRFAPILLYRLKTVPKLHDVIVAHPTLTGQQKSACALVMAEADKALCDGADEELWILEVALRVHKAVTS